MRPSARLRRSAVALVAAGVLLSAVPLACAAARTPVPTRGGALEGTEHDGVVAYLGIPYAVPPVGDLRWRAPQGLPRWPGVRRADHFGNDCMQVRRPSGPGASRTSGVPRPLSEDCLYLNVWTPAAAAGRVPVMVWLHGGAFSVGSASQPLYDGEKLARRGVVVVTLNYRLGKFGFFAHPALVNETPAGPIGNYGLLDQIAALKWVKENIAAFGGDPGNVTLFGQSAGGAAVSYLMQSPYARDLFQRAIIESGIFASAAVTLAQAEEAATTAATSWGLTNPDATALRKIPEEIVLGGGPALAGRSGPMVDGKVVPEDMFAAFDAGRVVHVPLLIGSNSYEAGFFPTRAQGLSQRFTAQWAKIEALFDGYGTHQTQAIEGELATDMLITAPTRRVARAAAAHGLPTYLYYFSYVRPSQRGSVPGASHIDEVYAVFDKLGSLEPQGGADTRRIVDEVESRWIEFAQSGRPTVRPRDWPALTSGSERLLEFTNTGVAVRRDFARARLDLAATLGAQAPPP